MLFCSFTQERGPEEGKPSQKTEQLLGHWQLLTGIVHGTKRYILSGHAQ